MPQPASDIALKMASSQFGAEPILVVAVTWGGSTQDWTFSPIASLEIITPGTTIWYASKTVGSYQGSIINSSNATNQSKTEFRGSNGNLTITLDDSNGFIKTLIDVHRVEKSPALGYLFFDGTTSDDLIPIIKGEITNPSYNEGARTFTFTIETIIEAREIGFAPTDEFTDLSPDMIGVAWPMVFGTCAHIPCPRVRRQTEGFLKIPIRLTSKVGVPSADASTIILDTKCHVQSYLDAGVVTDMIFVRDGNRFPQNQSIRIAIEGVIFEGSFGGDGDTFTVTKANIPAYQNVKFGTFPVGTPLAEQNDPTLAWITSETITNPDGSKMQINLAGMWAHLKTRPIGANPNPNAPAPGSIIWTTSIVKQENLKLELTKAPIDPDTKKVVALGNGDVILEAYAILPNGVVGESAELLDDLFTRINNGLALVKPVRRGLINKVINTIVNSTEHFWQVPADSRVTLWKEADPDIYIVSCIECSAVNGVYGHKRIFFPDGRERKVLAPIPSSYYTIQLQSNYKVNGSLATGLIFNKPLREFREEGWDGKIFATAISTVGPNPGDIIQWVLNTYAPQIKTPNMHNSVFHDANFVYRERRNAIEFAGDIAWQAKCALILDSYYAFLSYLATPPPLVLSVDESNTEKDSLELGFTPITQIKTKIIARWAITYKDRPEPAEYTELGFQSVLNIMKSIVDNDDRRHMDERVNVYRENETLYGIIEHQIQIFIYVDEDAVQDVLEFWGHRYANSWRTVRLKSFMGTAYLIAFDGVGLAYGRSDLANLAGITGLVTQVEVDFHSKSTTIKLWLPSVAGSTIIDSAAYSTPMLGGLSQTSPDYE